MRGSAIKSDLLEPIGEHIDDCLGSDAGTITLSLDYGLVRLARDYVFKFSQCLFQVLIDGNGATAVLALGSSVIDHWSSPTELVHRYS